MLQEARLPVCRGIRSHRVGVSVGLSLLGSISILAGLTPASVAAATLTVPTDHGTIQAALSASTTGDTVVVLPGTYAGPGNRDLTFGGKDLAVLGSGPDLTIIDCQGSPSEPHRGFDFNSGEGPSAVLEGFTIRNGYSANWSGGINCRASSPTIRDCVVEDCRAEVFGGGIGIWNGSDPRLEGCVLRDNFAAIDGGAVAVTGSTATLDGCELRSNEAVRWGGGVYAIDGDVVLLDCDVVSNTAGTSGGGIRLYDYRVEVRDSRIVGNRAGVTGGGIYAFAATVIVDGVLVAGNVSQNGGGLTVGPNAVWQIESSTVAGNRATGLGGGLWVSGDRLSLETTIFWGNCAVDGTDVYVGEDFVGPVTVSFACCALDTSQVGGPGTIKYTDDYVLDLDPHFCAPAACESAPTVDGDFALADDSPCLPQNNACGVLIGALPADCAAASVPDAAALPFEPFAYPSPLRSTDTLQLRLVEGDLHADLFDVAGRHLGTVWNGGTRGGRTGETVGWRPTAIPAGTYYLRIAGAVGSRTARIVVAG